eukprot:scaffold75186_cov15-Phaeocystis_antarctica.AAC.1
MTPPACSACWLCSPFWLCSRLVCSRPLLCSPPSAGSRLGGGEGPPVPPHETRASVQGVPTAAAAAAAAAAAGVAWLGGGEMGSPDEMASPDEI